MNERLRRLLNPRIAIPTLFFLVILATFGVIAMRTLIERSVTPDQVRVLASEALGRDVSAETIEVSALYGLVLRNVIVREITDSSVIFSARTVRLTPRWSELVSGVFEVAKLRVIDGEVFARKEPGTWNLLRLAAELEARDTSTVKPVFFAENLRFHMSGPKTEVWNGWIISFNEAALDPFAEEYECLITAIGAEECSIELRSADGEVEVEFSDLPRSLARLVDANLGYEGLAGKLTLRDNKLAGELSGKSLSWEIPRQGRVRVGAFRTKQVNAGMSPAGEWGATIENLKTKSLKISADFSGKGSTLARGKIEWEGPIEDLLEILPAATTRDVAGFRPTGSSAGHVIIGGSRADLAAISVTARGIALRTPKPIGSIPPNTVIANLRGRIGYAENVVTMDSLTMNWDDDQLTVSGNMKDSSHYDVRITSPRFALAKFPNSLPDGVSLDGKVGASLRVLPAKTTGTITFLGNNLKHSSGLALRLTGGDLSFGDNLALSNVAAAAGSGTLLVSGSIPTGDRQAIDLSVSLADAGIKELSQSLGRPLSFDSMTLTGGRLTGTLGVKGRLNDPAVRGDVVFADGSADVMGIAISAITGGVAFDSGSFKASGLTARVGDGTLKMDGNRDAARIVLGGVNSLILNPLIREAHPGVSVSGPIDADLTVKSGTALGTIVFRNSAISRGDLAVKSLTGSVEMKSDRTIARGIAGTYLDAPFKVDGTIPRADSGTYALTVAMNRVRLEHFKEFAPKGFEGSGPAEGVMLSIVGTPAAPKISGSVKMMGASIRMPFLASEVSEVTGDAGFGPDSFVTRGLTFKTGSSVVRISGGLEKFDEPVFHGLVIRSSDARLDDLVKLLPESQRPMPEGARVSGTVIIDTVRIDGPLERAKWSGAITLKGVGGELPGLEKGVTNIVGRVEFADGKVKASNLSGNVGSSSVHLEGEMDLASPYALSVKLAIKDADIAELWGAIPKPESWKALDFKGRGSVVANLEYARQKVKLDGKVTDGRTEGFGMTFDDMTGSFIYQDGVLTMSGLNAAWAQGKATDGYLRVALGQASPSFKASGKMHEVHLEKAVNYAGFAAEGYSGRMSGDFSVSGVLGRRESYNGAGSVIIRRARFEQLAPLDGLSRTLRMDFFSKGTYETAKGNFVVDKGVIRTVEPDHFRFMGSNFTLEARGYTDLDGACVYNYACGIDAGLVGNIMTTLRLSKLFSMEGEGGVLRTSGTIRGTLEKPIVKTDLGVLNVFR